MTLLLRLSLKPRAVPLHFTVNSSRNFSILSEPRTNLRRNVLPTTDPANLYRPLSSLAKDYADFSLKIFDSIASFPPTIFMHGSFLSW
jgi:hypothetical protein